MFRCTLVRVGLVDSRPMLRRVASLHRHRILSSLPLCAALTVAAGCESKTNPYANASAKPAASAAAPSDSAAPATKPSEMRDLIVDELGPFVGGERPKLAETGGKEKLRALIEALPLKDQKEITLVILKKARTPDVVAVFNELARAGAPKVKLKTDGRDDLPKEIVVVPQALVSDAPKCSVVAMIREDLSSAVWSLTAGHARNHQKGFAGPDLSHTSETLEKEFPKCKSSVAFFSADDSVPWEHAHNLAGTMLGADKEKQIETLVLLSAAPVAGRDVSIAAPP